MKTAQARNEEDHLRALLALPAADGQPAPHGPSARAFRELHEPGPTEGGR